VFLSQLPGNAVKAETGCVLARVIPATVDRNVVQRGLPGVCRHRRCARVVEQHGLSAFQPSMQQRRVVQAVGLPERR